LQAATKKLPVSAILFGILAGIVGGVVGLVLGIFLGSALAAAFHVSPMEGGAGYFAVAIALLVGALVCHSGSFAVRAGLLWRVR